MGAKEFFSTLPPSKSHGWIYPIFCTWPTIAAIYKLTLKSEKQFFGIRPSGKCMSLLSNLPEIKPSYLWAIWSEFLHVKYLFCWSTNSIGCSIENRRLELGNCKEVFLMPSWHWTKTYQNDEIKHTFVNKNCLHLFHNFKHDIHAYRITLSKWSMTVWVNNGLIINQNQSTYRYCTYLPL